MSFGQRSSSICVQASTTPGVPSGSDPDSGVVFVSDRPSAPTWSTPSASRVTISVGWTSRWIPRSWRSSTSRTVSTRNGMSSVTNINTERGECQPSRSRDGATGGAEGARPVDGGDRGGGIRGGRGVEVVAPPTVGVLVGQFGVVPREAATRAARRPVAVRSPALRERSECRPRRCALPLPTHRSVAPRSAAWQDGAMTTQLNVLGTELQPCSFDPVTGFYRSGCCENRGDDPGMHTVCCRRHRRLPGVLQGAGQRPVHADARIRLRRVDRGRPVVRVRRSVEGGARGRAGRARW